MILFLRKRGRSLALVVLVMFLISGLQGAIFYTVGEGSLRRLESGTFLLLVAGFYSLRVVFLLLLAILWVLNRKRALFRTIIVANVYFTLGLLVDVVSFPRVLARVARSAGAVIRCRVDERFQHAHLFHLVLDHRSSRSRRRTAR